MVQQLYSCQKLGCLIQAKNGCVLMTQLLMTQPLHACSCWTGHSTNPRIVKTIAQLLIILRTPASSSLHTSVMCTCLSPWGHLQALQPSMSCEPSGINKSGNPADALRVIVILQALQTLDKVISEKLEDLSEITATPTSQLKFVTDAWSQVVDCRRMLKWTYAFGYYRFAGDAAPNKPQQEFFEFNQVNIPQMLSCKQHGSTACSALLRS